MIHVKSAGVAGTVAAAAESPAVQAVQPAAARFFHLDALRAFLMFWGILVHTSTLDPDNKLFRGFALVSGLVRMEAFFVISGFLAYMLLKKYGAAATLRKRALAIGVPFVTALLILNPVTNYLIHTFHNGPIPFSSYLQGNVKPDAAGPMNWHLHLWFLLALLFYSLLVPVGGKLVDRGVAAVRINLQAPRLVFFAMAAGVAGACLASRVGFELIKDFIPGSLHYVVRSIGNFLPFHLLGMLLFASPKLREVFSQVHWVQLLLSCALLAVADRQAGPDPGRVGEIAILCLQGYVAMTLSSLLFWIAGKWVRGESERVRRLSDSAYTVYLFHFLVIYLFAHLLRGVVPGSMALLTLVAAATFATTLCLHRFVIHRLTLLAFLFNGKPLRRPK